MKIPSVVAVLIFLLLIGACSPTYHRAPVTAQPAISATGYEALQAKQERERDDAALAAEATQKQLDALKKEVDELKRREAEGKAKPPTVAALSPLEQLRKQLSDKTPPPPQADPNAKAIDAEVAGILGGHHGQLPPAQKVSGNTSGIVSVRVTNDTPHILTVLYSGATSKKSVLGPRQSETVTLTAGAYSVAARVDEPSVIPFAGKDTLSGGDYNNSFYIVASTR